MIPTDALAVLQEMREETRRRTAAGPFLETRLAALDTAIAAVQGQTWQPIETAPKDGTRFLAWGPMLQVAECEWRTRWGDDDEGWYRTNQHPIVQPSHWMKLPSPPEARALFTQEPT